MGGLEGWRVGREGKGRMERKSKVGREVGRWDREEGVRPVGGPPSADCEGSGGGGSIVMLT